jgi:hypothetical protein
VEPLGSLRTRFTTAEGDERTSSEDLRARIETLEALHREFAAQLDATEAVFRADRRAHWAELQARLARVDRA